MAGCFEAHRPESAATQSGTDRRDGLGPGDGHHPLLADAETTGQAKTEPEPETPRSNGTSARHDSIAIGQRVWKAQPEGGRSGLAGSPAIGTRSTPAAGMAPTSARV